MKPEPITDPVIAEGIDTATQRAVVREFDRAEKAEAKVAELTASLTQQTQIANDLSDRAEAQVKELRAELAECYRLSGADPDGDSDSMLARHAVEEVRRLREESDRAGAKAQRYKDALETYEGLGASLGAVARKALSDKEGK